MSSDGTKFFFIDKSNKFIEQWSLSTAYDLSTGSGSRDTRYYVGNTVGNARCIAFSPDGHRLFIGSSSADKIYQYTLATAFDISPGNLSSDGNFDLLNSNTQPMPIQSAP